MFLIQRVRCATCIYRNNSFFDLEKLENQIRNKYGGFNGWRICHHTKNVCCKGFWDHHKDEFQVGQVVQRMNYFKFVDIDERPFG